MKIETIDDSKVKRINFINELISYMKIVPTACSCCGNFTPENNQIWIESDFDLEIKNPKMICTKCYNS